MTGDGAAPKLRERVWIEKFDHTGAEPQLVETVMLENGQIVARSTSTGKE